MSEFDKNTEIQAGATSGMSLVTTLSSGHDFDISYLPMWFELTGDEQYFCELYLKSNLQKTLTCVNAGMSVSVFNNMLKKNPIFNEAVTMLEELLHEGIESLHLIDAFTDPKIRAGYVKTRAAQKAPKQLPVHNNTQINFNVDGTGKLSDIIKNIAVVKQEILATDID